MAVRKFCCVLRAHGLVETLPGDREKREMRRKHAGLLAVFVMAACALPIEPQPTPAPPAPTAAQPGASGAADRTPTPLRSSAAPPAAPTAPVSASSVPSLGADELSRIAAAIPLPRDQVALAAALKGISDVREVARTTPLDVNVGDVETFWVVNFADHTRFQVDAKLRYAGPVVLMYVDTRIEADIDQAAIEQSAHEFEQMIYPRNRALFGMEATPGVDGDPRLTVLNALVPGVGGYFSAADGVVKAVNRFSNEREMFVINVTNSSFGSPSYALTLAHEFQHMIEWNVARRSPAWFNEGMSTLAQDLNGYVENGLPGVYLSNPDIQLTTFSQASADRGVFSAHYGASQLFLRYFQEQYAGEGGLADLIKADAGNNLDAFVQVAARKRPDILSFADIYANWAVANVLNDPTVADGRYAYARLPKLAAIGDLQGDAAQATVQQFGVDYYGNLVGPLTLAFDGADTVSLVGAVPREGRAMWWSNRGDDSVETLTRAFDLSGAQRATLQFSAWYELELNFDYAFVSVSADGGTTWAPLKGSTTTEQDPQGHNYGNGLTGVSGAAGVDTSRGTRGQWIEEQVDLTPYAGKHILLRFWVVNDDTFNAPGMLIDNIRIPELSYVDGAEQSDGDWQAQGFVRTSGELPQTWALRLIRMSGGTISVEHVPADAQGRATVTLADGERGTLAVIGIARFTTEPAGYSYSVTRP
jgi:immune inhibitor A